MRRMSASSPAAAITATNTPGRTKCKRAACCDIAIRIVRMISSMPFGVRKKRKSGELGCNGPCLRLEPLKSRNNESDGTRESLRRKSIERWSDDQSFDSHPLEKANSLGRTENECSGRDCVPHHRSGCDHRDAHSALCRNARPRVENVISVRPVSYAAFIVARRADRSLRYTRCGEYFAWAPRMRNSDGPWLTFGVAARKITVAARIDGEILECLKFAGCKVAR